MKTHLMRPITKGKAARGGYDRAYRAVPQNPFVSRAKVNPGTYMMNPNLAREGLDSSFLDYGKENVWDDVPLNMQLRTLSSDGTTRSDRGRMIENNEAFFVTGEAYVSKQGNVVLVQVIPSDGYPGWVELNKINSRSKPGTSGDLATDTVNSWFTQHIDTKWSKTRR